MDLKAEIKSYIVKSNRTMKSVVEELNDKYDYKESVPNLSNKLRKNTIKYKEVQDIAQILGYTLKWEKTSPSK